MSLRRPSPAAAPDPEASPGAHPAAAEGYVLPVALIIAMAVIVSAVSLAGRGLSGLAGSAISNSGNEARDAAEAGIDLIMSRLNQPRNRQLMLAAVPMGQWGSSDPAIRAQLTNPCQPTANPPTDSRGTDITAADFGINGSFVSLPGSGNRQYRLLRLTVRGPEGSGASYSSSGSSGTLSGGYTPRLINLASRSNTGQLELEVEGRSLSGGTSPRVQLRRTFELVPKQCGRSFGRSADDIGLPIPAAGLWSHGNDFRYSNTFPGLLLGLAGGSFTLSGISAFDLVRLNPDGSARSTEQPLSVLCRIASSASTCGASTAVDGVPLRLAPDLPAISNPNGVVPGWSAAELSTACVTTPKPTCIGPGTGTTYIRINSAKSNVERCDLSKGSCVDFSKACAKDSATSITSFHCRSNLSSTASPGGVYTIDTTRGPIYLYYSSSWYTGGGSSPTSSASATIKHVYCPGTDGSAECKISASASTGTTPTGSIARAGIIGISSGFTLQPGGASSKDCLDPAGTDGLRDLLVWLPTGTLRMASSSCFRGVAYVNTLSISGNPTLAVSDPLRVDDALTWLGSTLSDSDPFSSDLRRVGMALYDVVARRSISTGLVNR